ncbi:MBL fold metallo-hydrolase [Malonomonas rubra]|uniref:MBL fold metallo-hydrolase n=1 Tax=Malonomonas rubra TaxID=57040 RepID=UPI0026EA1366|nr:MBL fold metallo-hydrolase [Malonomonas rubra]
MKIRLTILCENSVERVSPAGLLGEHGFSCHLQTEQGDYLFDTGAGQTILLNSDKLNIDLTKLQGIFLSHGHLDHTGGLRQVLERTGPIPIFGHPDIFQIRHSRNGNQLRAIGIPWHKEQLETLGAIFHLDRSPQQVGTQLTLSGEVPRCNEFETGDPHLIILDEQGKEIPDPLADDLSLFIDSPNGLILLLGCAHAGVLNIIEHARKVTGQDKICMLIGGTHLKFSNTEQLEATLDRLEELNIAKIGVSHCTGLRQAQQLADRFGERFFNASVGQKIVVDNL